MPCAKFHADPLKTVPCIRNKEQTQRHTQTQIRLYIIRLAFFHLHCLELSFKLVNIPNLANNNMYRSIFAENSTRTMYIRRSLLWHQSFLYHFSIMYSDRIIHQKLPLQNATTLPLPEVLRQCYSSSMDSSWATEETMTQCPALSVFLQTPQTAVHWHSPLAVTPAHPLTQPESRTNTNHTTSHALMNDHHNNVSSTWFSSNISVS